MYGSQQLDIRNSGRLLVFPGGAVIEVQFRNTRPDCICPLFCSATAIKLLCTTSLHNDGRESEKHCMKTY